MFRVPAFDELQKRNQLDETGVDSAIRSSLFRGPEQMHCETKPVTRFDKTNR